LKTILLTIFLIGVGLNTGVTAEGAKLEQKTEEFFPIGVWFEGAPGPAEYPADKAGAKKYYDRCFADLAAHGFNCVAVPNCPESLWQTLLESAQENKIKVILEVRPLVELICRDKPLKETEVYKTVKRVVDKIGNYSSLLRYQVRDEPPPEQVQNWLVVRNALEEIDPSRPAFSCFCNPDSLKAATDAAKFSETCFDIYPHYAKVPAQTMGNFIELLYKFKRASRDNAMWAVLQSFAKPEAWRYPSHEELRAVTYLSIAAGAKGIFYFLYQTMPKHSEVLDGLINVDGSPRPLYSTAETLARELGKLAPLLMSLKPAEQTAEISGPARAGSFKDPNGNPVLIVASARPGEGVTVTVSVTTLETGSWKDALTGEVFSAKNGELAIPLAPGAGRVLKSTKD